MTRWRFHVEHVALTPDRRGLIHDTDTGQDPSGDNDRRHLFSADIASPAPPRALTPSMGYAFATATPFDDRVVFVVASRPRRWA